VELDLRDNGGRKSDLTEDIDDSVHDQKFQQIKKAVLSYADILFKLRLITFLPEIILKFCKMFSWPFNFFIEVHIVIPFNKGTKCL
jgi:hypothetical protein